MHFIILFKFKGKPTRKFVKTFQTLLSKKIEGFKPYGLYWTFGSVNATWHVEAENLASVFSVALQFKDSADLEVMPALSLEEGASLL
ncbi:TPA: DUF3303 domain-containing protein [Candidatus Bathyarchaeota archaeon]|nr:DUF3303 domain-containing protein [Candidatus Bathyarchaeota archaeon]